MVKKIFAQAMGGLTPINPPRYANVRNRIKGFRFATKISDLS